MQRFLSKSPSWLVVSWCCLAAFGTYFCMYAFRKPFTAATFSGMEWMGMQYKSILLIAQILGYMTSKFLGIKIISELSPGKRIMILLSLCGIAELALVLFAAVPAPYNAVFLFINGLPLGMIWGIVFSFLEGRKYTEVLAAGLAVSFIISSGFLKSMGRYLIIDTGVSEFQMPYIMGLIFTPLLLLFSWMLTQVPAPNEEDIKLKTVRPPMTKDDRRELLKKYGVSIVLVVLLNTLFTTFRGVRDDFAVEFWNEMGYADTPSIFATLDTPIGLVILVVIGSLVRIRKNSQAFKMIHNYLIVGMILCGISSLLYMMELVSPIVWWVGISTGIFLSYITIQTVYFERFIAYYRIMANVGFLMYIADSIGYLGNTIILFMKDFLFESITWKNFFLNTSIGLFFICTALSIWLYKIHFRKNKAQETVPNSAVLNNVSTT